MPSKKCSASAPKSISPVRVAGNRPAVMRMKRIFDLLKKDDFPNCQRIADELETAAKTIQRDINFMRDRLGLPIEYDPQEHGYHFTEEVHEFPTVQVTQGELLALMVAHKAIEQYRGTPYHAQLETAFAKLLAPLKDMGGYAPNHEIISFKITAPAAQEMDVFDKLTHAVADQFEISFDYRKPGESKPAPRRLQPLHLANRDGRWYLIGHCLDRGAMRTFALGRIADLKLSSRWFERPKDFSVENYFAKSITVMNGTEDHLVRIRFSKMAADHVRDRFWHESQEITAQPDGRLVLALRLSDLLEVERIVLKWGGHAEALEPAALRMRLVAAGKAIASAHG
jgi:predicted DNA-binding transcriptional regulator YafY